MATCIRPFVWIFLLAEQQIEKQTSFEYNFGPNLNDNTSVKNFSLILISKFYRFKLLKLYKG